MTEHKPLISLASGVLPECPAETVARAARDTGYDAVGLMIDERWTDATTLRVRRLLDECLLPVLDVEVVWIQPGVEQNKDHDRLIDIGGELGARNVLIVSSDPDTASTCRAFERLCCRAQANGMRAVLEFLMITEIRSLSSALDIVTSVGHPAGGVLIDSLHLDRCGGRPEDLDGLDPSLIPYVQLCDGPATVPGTSYEDYLSDAIDARTAPGEGDLPLLSLMQHLPPGTPLSLEVRSLHYRNRYPDPTRRAQKVLHQSRKFLDSIMV